MLVKIFAYSIVALLFISCSCSDDPNQSKELKQIPIIDTFSVRLDFLPDRLEVDAALSIIRDSIKELRIKLQDAEWDKALRYFKPYFNSKARLWLVILYLDKTMQKFDSVTLEDILGFQVYYIFPENVLYHRIYLPNIESKFEEYYALTSEAKGIDCASKSYMEDELLNFRNVTKSNYTQLYLFPHDSKPFKPNYNSYHEIIDRIQSLYDKKKF
jgi:hypothetical protein